MFQQSVYNVNGFPCIGIDNFGVECRVLVTDKPVYCTSFTGTIMGIMLYTKEDTPTCTRIPSLDDVVPSPQYDGRDSLC